jgi:hypothetical protein
MIMVVVVVMMMRLTLHPYTSQQLVFLETTLCLKSFFYNYVSSEKVCHSYLTNSVAQEPEGSSPHSPQPATGLCPEPVESNPHAPSQSP